MELIRQGWQRFTQSAHPSRQSLARAGVVLAGVLAILALSATGAQADIVKPKDNDGWIRLTARVCGTSAGWQTNQARNGGGAWVYMGTNYDIRCQGEAVTSQRPAQPKVSRSSVSTGGWAHPLGGASCGARDFGTHLHPIKKTRLMHYGQDMRASSGANIYAVAAGSIVQAGWRGGYGNAIEIQHADGSRSFYAHASKLLRTGGSVGRGEHIAEVGSTGLSTGAHLHFGAKNKGGSWADPRSVARAHGLSLC